MSIQTFGDVPFSETGKIGNKKSDYAILGLPSDLGADTISGQMTGSLHIRKNSECIDKYNYFGLTTINKKVTVVDCGDLIPDSRNIQTYTKEIITNVNQISQNTKTLIVLGGDDSVSYGVAMGLYLKHKDLVVLHYDAHNDMYETDQHNTPYISLTHSNWISHLKRKTKIPVTQFGCRALSENKPLNEVKQHELIYMTRPTLIVVDVDVIDPAYAPAVSCPEPFGFTPSELYLSIKDRYIAGRNNIVGIVFTEVNVFNDQSNKTGILISNLIQRLIYT